MNKEEMVPRGGQSCQEQIWAAERQPQKSQNSVGVLVYVLLFAAVFPVFR
jgi:hypothetical protein